MTYMYRLGKRSRLCVRMICHTRKHSSACFMHIFIYMICIRHLLQSTTRSTISTRVPIATVMQTGVQSNLVQLMPPQGPALKQGMGQISHQHLHPLFRCKKRWRLYLIKKQFDPLLYRDEWQQSANAASRVEALNSNENDGGREWYWISVKPIVFASKVWTYTFWSRERDVV